MDRAPGRAGELGPYGKVKPIPANLRNYLGMLDVMEGKGPIYMQTEEAIQKIAESDGRSEGRQEEDEGARVRGLGRLPRHDDLPGDPLGGDQHRARGEALRDRRGRAVLHRLPLRRLRRLGQRSRRTSRPPEYFWGYENMSTVKGLFAPVTPPAPRRTSSPPARTPRVASRARRRSATSSTRSRPSPTVRRRRDRRSSRRQILKPLELFEENKGADDADRRQPATTSGRRCS